MTLSDRLEQAEAGSRELDAEIALASGMYVREKRGRDRQEWFYPTSGGYRKSTSPYAAFDGLPRYTTSIDAALSLVPEGWAGLVPLRGGPNEGVWLWPEGKTINRGIRLSAATPALTICAAALRAKGL